MSHRAAYVEITDGEMHADVRLEEDLDVAEVSISLPRVGIPARSRRKVVDQVFLLPELQGAALVRVSLPLGESDALTALQQHLSDMQTRAAGATCLVEGRLRVPGITASGPENTTAPR